MLVLLLLLLLPPPPPPPLLLLLLLLFCSWNSYRRRHQRCCYYYTDVAASAAVVVDSVFLLPLLLLLFPSLPLALLPPWHPAVPSWLVCCCCCGCLVCLFCSCQMAAKFCWQHDQIVTIDRVGRYVMGLCRMLFQLRLCVLPWWLASNAPNRHSVSLGFEVWRLMALAILR